jgi:hypothetical protein
LEKSFAAHLKKIENEENDAGFSILSQIFQDSAARLEKLYSTLVCRGNPVVDLCSMISRFDIKPVS